MIKVNAFLARVKEIVASNPSYRTGGSGADGTCDCIGLIMGAMARNGQKQYPLHSSNYFARYEMKDLEPLETQSLAAGHLVYKARVGNLNGRYLEGGRYYTGDLLDYYHVGVVTSVNPLEITHCTSGDGVDGITTDSSPRGWEYSGRMKNVDYEDGTEEEPNMAYTAFVTATNGKTVNLRKRPDANSELVVRVRIGDVVSVQESAAGWSQVITAAGHTGYMMDAFLKRFGEEEEPKPEEPDFQQQVLEKLDRILERLEGGDG